MQPSSAMPKNHAVPQIPEYTPTEIVCDAKKFWGFRLSKKQSTFGTGHKYIIPDSQWTSNGWEETRASLKWRHSNPADCVQNGRPHLQKKMGREVLNPGPTHYRPTQDFDSNKPRSADVSFTTRPKAYKPSLFVPEPTLYALPGSLPPEPLAQRRMMTPSSTASQLKQHKHGSRKPGPTSYDPNFDMKFRRPRTVDLERSKKGFPRTTIDFCSLQIFEDYKNEVNSNALQGEDPTCPGPADYDVIELGDYLSTSRPPTRDITLKGRLPLLGQPGM
jgi:hypothetical protein